MPQGLRKAWDAMGTQYVNEGGSEGVCIISADPAQGSLTPDKSGSIESKSQTPKLASIALLSGSIVEAVRLLVWGRLVFTLNICNSIVVLVCNFA
jgi:hypothetical protein